MRTHADKLACRAHGRMRLGVAVIFLGAAWLLVPPAMTAPRTALVLHWDGAIGPATADYIARGLRQAADEGAAVAVLRLDTPGGLDTSMREIIRTILGSSVPVITYVHPSGARAASAGMYILYASHVAAMSPGTNLGAATPVAIGGGLPLPGSDEDDRRPDDGGGDDADGDGPAGAGKTPGQERDGPAGRGREPVTGDAMKAKAINDAVAYVRSLAELRGRNADWAETAVRDAASLSAAAALERNVIDIVARDLDDLLAQAHGRTVSNAAGEVVLDTEQLVLEHFTPDWRTQLLAAITNPNVALILMMIGIYGLIFEFMNPGALYPGTIGGICLLLGLYALAALPVNYAGLALMLLGILLMAGEAFAPSFGVLGVGGAIAFVLGATILIDTEAPGYDISWPVIVAVAAGSFILSAIIVRLAYTASRRPARTGPQGMIGTRGRVLEWNDGHGYVIAHGERWQAVAAQPLSAGAAVRIIDIDGLTLEVTADHPDDSPGNRPDGGVTDVR